MDEHCDDAFGHTRAMRSEVEWKAFAEAARHRAKAGTRQVRGVVESAFRAAFSCDYAAAVEVLTELSNARYALVALTLSHAGCASNHDEALQRPLFDELHRRLPVGAAEKIDLGEFFLEAWALRADQVLSSASIVQVLAKSTSDARLISRLVEQRLASSRLEDARIFADALSPYWKDAKATALARLGVAERALEPTQTLMPAIEIISATPLIQDGGEEADAVASVFRVFAHGGVDADDSAVLRGVELLRRLTKKRVEKDVCGWGAANAVESCALRRDDPKWLAVAGELIGYIWDQNHIDRARLALQPVVQSGPSIVQRYVEARLARDDKAADAVLVEAPFKRSQARWAAIEQLHREGRDAEATEEARRAASIEFVGLVSHAKDLSALDILLAATPDKTHSLSALAELVARLGASEQEVDRVVVLLDEMGDPTERLSAFGSLAVTTAEERRVEFLIRALSPGAEQLVDRLSLAIATAHALARAGRRLEAGDVLWQARAQLSERWIQAAERCGDVTLLRRIIAAAREPRWLSSAYAWPKHHQPRFDPLGRMLELLPPEEGDAAEEALVSGILQQPLHAERAGSLLAGRAANPVTRMRRLAHWQARWPNWDDSFFRGIGPGLVAHPEIYEPIFAKASTYAASSEFALALARERGTADAIRWTEHLGEWRAAALVRLAENNPADAALVAKAARKMKKGRRDYEKAEWHRANASLALLVGDLDGALAVYAAMKFWASSAQQDVGIAVARAIEKATDPSRCFTVWLNALVSFDMSPVQVLAVALPTLWTRLDAPARAQARSVVEATAQRCRRAEDRAAYLVPLACGELLAGSACEGLVECVAQNAAQYAFEEIGCAIGRTGRSDALAAHFRATQLWSVRDVAGAIGKVAEVIPSKLFLRALREAELPKAVPRAALSRALSTLATDPENIAEVIKMHADDEPLVTAALEWLSFALLIRKPDAAS